MGDVVVVGSINVDTVVRVGTLPRPGETVAGHDPVVTLGGKGANQAVAAARLGSSTRLVGAIGDDERGPWARTALASAGVDVTAVRQVAGTTGTAVVLVDDAAENSIVVSPGANGRVSTADLDGLLGGADDVVLVQLEVPDEVVTTALAAAPGTVVLNAAPVRALPATAWSDVDVLVVNEVEQAALGHSPVARVVTTLGADGCVVRDRARLWRIAAPAVDAVDTTGAGDAFCGALGAALADGVDLVEAARRATLVGALTTLSTGAQSSPTAADLAGHELPRVESL